MSLPDVNQLVLAILSGAGSRRVTLWIKRELKHVCRHANNATSLCAWGKPRHGARGRSRALGPRTASRPCRGPTASSRAMRTADGRARHAGLHGTRTTRGHPHRGHGRAMPRASQQGRAGDAPRRDTTLGCRGQAARAVA
jgi:hypothetical protein